MYHMAVLLSYNSITKEGLSGRLDAWEEDQVNLLL